jgi:hypothetical protein
MTWGLAVRRFVVLTVFCALFVFVGVSAAAAVDYPPTTTARPASTVQVAGTSAENDPSVAVGAESQSGGLPFTGGNSMALVIVGAVLTSVGGLAVTRSRRRVEGQ